MDSRKKKIIAPIVISILVILYYVVYFGVIVFLLEGMWKYALGLIPVILSAVMIKVCIERIREVRKGEEDDLSKY